MKTPAYENEKLCLKIKEVFPDIGECGIDVNVQFDESAGAYVVNMKKNDRDVKTFLEAEDAAVCMAGNQCVKLGVQIGQIKGDEYP